MISGSPVLQLVQNGWATPGRQEQVPELSSQLEDLVEECKRCASMRIDMSNANEAEQKYFFFLNLKKES